MYPTDYLIFIKVQDFNNTSENFLSALQGNYPLR